MFLYLDPGSGSFLLQIIIAAALGSLYAFRTFWARLWRYACTIFRKDAPK